MDDEQEIDLDQITDTNLLQSLLDQTDDPEDRKVIRDRIKELQATKKRESDEKLAKLTNTRQDLLQEKKKEAEQHKQRTLEMYDKMAKSAPSGGQKKQDVNILKTESTTRTTTTTTKTTAASPPVKLTNLPAPVGPKTDFVEDAIKKRQREAEDRKRRIMAAYDVAAKSGAAGSTRDVDLDVANTIDMEQYELNKQSEGSSTFQMSGGVSIFKRNVSVPASPPIQSQPKYDEMDAMERALRDRQRDCEEQKRKLLERYSQVSKGQAGPKIFV
jgi:hypothetical protein